MLLLLDIIGNHIEETKNILKQYIEQTTYIKIDVTQEESIINLMNLINEKYGYLDVLINNAAYDKMDSIEKFNNNEFKKILETNLVGKAMCIKHAIKLLEKSEYPSIINIASRLAERPMPDSSAYCSGAAGIVMLSKCAALELSSKKIRVNCVSPSLTLTPLAIKSYTKKEIAKTAEKSLNKRLCKMEDIFSLVNFLISKKADYINGENINISGGILLK